MEALRQEQLKELDLIHAYNELAVVIMNKQEESYEFSYDEDEN